jgi:aryl-alcohol dehydrogenase-like predicted oxidoreductase
MKYRQLGTTDLNLSEVGFGVWSVSTGWWGHVDKPDAIRLLQDAQELGVNFFDTADTYAEGYGEKIMREALGKSRKDVIIGTKFGYDLEAPREGHKERPQKWDPEFIRTACESSLLRMGTDYIDLYQLHNPRIGTVQDDAVFEALGDLVKEGKVRHVGIALGPDIGWFDEGETAMRERNISSLQVIYSIIEQQPARQFFPIAGEQKTGLLARVPHASEVLTDTFADKAKMEFDPSDHRAHRKQEWLDKAFQKRDKVLFIAQDTGRTLAQAAIQFVLTEGQVASVLPNIVTKEQLVEFTKAAEVSPVNAEELAELYRLYDEEFQVLESIQPQKG